MVFHPIISMKLPLRPGFSLLTLLCVVVLPLCAPALRAQTATVQFYLVNKIANYGQGSTSTPTLAASLPYSFNANVNGSNLNLLAGGASFSSPLGSTNTGGSLTLDSGNTGYKFSINYTSKANLDGAFNNGTYKMSVGTFTGLTLGLATDSYPTSIPQVTGTTNGAIWNGSGQLVINANTGDTLNFSSFSAYTSGNGGHIDFSINGTFNGTAPSDAQAVWIGATQQAAITSYTIPAGSLISGQTYSADLQFTSVVGAPNTSGPSGSEGVGAFSNDLSFTILAIPEPADEALGLAAGALLALMIFRRRRMRMA